jgi:5'-nucleotidase
MESTSGEDAPKRNPLPSALVSNLQSVLAARRPAPTDEVSTAAADGEAEAGAPAAEASDSPPADGAPAKPVVLLTCAGGIRSAGLAALVDALVAGGRCDVHVCASESYVPLIRASGMLIGPHIAPVAAKYSLLPLDLLRYNFVALRLYR